MRRWLFLFIALIPSPAPAQLIRAEPKAVGVSPAGLAKVTGYLRTLEKTRQVTGGVVMMARRDRVVLHEAVGLMDREKKIPMEEDTIFRIASMTKPIISAAIMILVEEGKVRLDDPLSKYIPEFADPLVLTNAQPTKAKRGIRIRDLLSHTSGLVYPSHEALGPRYNAAGITIGTMIERKTLREMMVRLADIPLAFHPGDDWHYGMSADVLGRVIEVASDTPLDKFLVKRVFRPLDMKDTYFRVPNNKVSRVAGLYHIGKAGKLTRIPDGATHMDAVARSPFSPDFAYNDAHRYRGGGGGLCSTSADYMRFCLMLMNDGAVGRDQPRLLKSDSVKLLRTNQLGVRIDDFNKFFGRTDRSIGFGYGFMVVLKDRERPQLEGSYQWYGGYSTSFSIAPKQDWAIVVMLQTAWNDDTLKWAEEFKRRAAAAVAN